MHAFGSAHSSSLGNGRGSQCPGGAPSLLLSSGGGLWTAACPLWLPTKAQCSVRAPPCLPGGGTQSVVPSLITLAFPGSLMSLETELTLATAAQTRPDICSETLGEPSTPARAGLCSPGDTNGTGPHMPSWGSFSGEDGSRSQSCKSTCVDSCAGVCCGHPGDWPGSLCTPSTSLVGRAGYSDPGVQMALGPAAPTLTPISSGVYCSSPSNSKCHHPQCTSLKLTTLCPTCHLSLRSCPELHSRAGSLSPAGTPAQLCSVSGPGGGPSGVSGF